MKVCSVTGAKMDARTLWIIVGVILAMVHVFGWIAIVIIDYAARGERDIPYYALLFVFWEMAGVAILIEGWRK